MLPGLGAVKAVEPEELTTELVEESQPPSRPVRKGRVTRVQDPELRAAIENHAVDRAIEDYQAAGGINCEKLGKPYDVRLTLHGQERHIEVKGSSLAVETIELTMNEVTHAETFQPTDLVVVDSIGYSRTADGITTSGGRLRKWSDWRPAGNDLSPRKFAYDLPTH